MNALVVLCAVLIFVVVIFVVYLLIYRAVGPGQQDLRRRADENAQKLFKRHREQDQENLDRDEEYQ